MRRLKIPARTRIAALALLATVPGVAAAQDGGFAGSWEGEFETPRAPVFMTLHLERDGSVWRGGFVALGRTFEFHEVAPTDAGLRATLTGDPEGFRIELVRAEGRLEGQVLEAGESYPVRLDRVPVYPAARTRDEAWLQDLDALATRFLRFDRSFGPGARARFLERIEALRAEVPRLDDSRIVMRMAAAVALSGNAHTRLYLLRNRTELRRLPLRLWWFADGLRVVRATEPHADLLGCRVDRVGGVPARRARAIVSAAFAGNESWTDYKSVYYLTSPEALHGFGIAPDPESVPFTFSGCGGEPFERRLEPLPLVRSRDPVEAWWDLSPERREAGWLQALDRPGSGAPRYLADPDRHYRFEVLDDPGLLYLRYSRASEMEAESLDEFAGRVLTALRERPLRAVVVDLRFNTGGNLSLASDLMADLERETRGLRRYVITGRATFSAGISHAASWAEAGDVVIVGEPVGDELDTWSEGGNIILPNSGLAAHFANAFHSYSRAPCPPDVPCFLDLSAPELRPDLPASPTWDEYRAGVDVALEAVLRDLGRAGSAPGPGGDCLRRGRAPP